MDMVNTIEGDWSDVAWLTVSQNPVPVSKSVEFPEQPDGMTYGEYHKLHKICTYLDPNGKRSGLRCVAFYPYEHLTVGGALRIMMFHFPDESYYNELSMAFMARHCTGYGDAGLMPTLEEVKNGIHRALNPPVFTPRRIIAQRCVRSGDFRVVIWKKPDDPKFPHIKLEGRELLLLPKKAFGVEEEGEYLYIFDETDSKNDRITEVKDKLERGVIVLKYA